MPAIPEPDHRKLRTKFKTKSNKPYRQCVKAHNDYSNSTMKDAVIKAGLVNV